MVLLRQIVQGDLAGACQFQEAKDTIFRLKPQDLSLPVRTDRGYVVLSVKSVQLAHPGSLEEVRDRVITELKREKSAELAKSKAEELIKRVKSGEKFDAAARALGLESKTSDPWHATALFPAWPAASSSAQLSAQGWRHCPHPLSLGQSWLVYRVADKTEANPADFEKQKTQLTRTCSTPSENLAF